MKKIFYLVILLLIGCSQKEEGCCCMNVETIVEFEVSKDRIPNFLDAENNLDRENVYFFQKIGETEKRIEFEMGGTSEKVLFYNYSPEFLSGKEETLYLKSKRNTDIIKIKGSIVRGKCSIYIEYDYIIVNGKETKVENGIIMIE